MDKTPAQVERLAKLLRDFGTKTIKDFTPNKAGIMRVEATAHAGVWNWYFDQDGTLIQQYFRQGLFDMPRQAPKPRNAIDN